MAMSLIHKDGWKIIYDDMGEAGKAICDVSGDGEYLELPDSITELRHHSFDRISCPNLVMVVIPESVKKAQRNTFNGFGEELEVLALAPERPEGFFEGEFDTEQYEDGGIYTVTHYGSWLTATIALANVDDQGRRIWMSSETPDTIKRPSIRWGYGG
ncbi:MAG: hypothetical protein IJ751_05340 [Oscillospiraceae bacterium]|nr:hypothetical protein [Oscillospiraceae bacterium]